MKKEIADSIEDYLDKCPVTNKSHVRSHWKDVDIRCVKQDWDTETTRLYVEGGTKPVIYTYPVIETLNEKYQAFLVLREFGDYLLSKATPEMTEVWDKKLVVATVEQVNAFQSRLNTGFSSYQEVVDSLKSPIDRLVALHLSNALMYNGQAYAGASNIDVREWGPTSDLANGTSYYSLVPLTSAYSPRSVHKDFGTAFASYVVYGLSGVLHSDVRDAMVGLVERIVDSAR